MPFSVVYPPIPSGGVLVNLYQQLQHIDGFGASDANDFAAMTSGQADTFFSQSLGIGLSILRVGIWQDGTYGISGNPWYTNAVYAAARGAKVVAIPWTAPAAYKDSGSLDGGNLLSADYSAWASIMAGFQATLVSNGGPNLYAVSVQNEPDESESYASMTYSDSTMNAFVKVLSPALAALSPAPLLMMPEPASWSLVSGYLAALDGTSSPEVNIVSAHQYGGVSAPSGSLNVPIWQCEMSDFNTFDATITQGLSVAQWINDALVIGRVSAWCYWGLLGSDGYTDNEALAGYEGVFTSTKRLYVMGNWSKFVRPGQYMVATSANQPISGVYITAFVDPVTSKFVIVAVNQNTGSQTFPISVFGSQAYLVTPWLTNSSNNLVAQSTIRVSGGMFSVTLPASSVTSFVSN